jgi:predicted MFS family arabinose efflux permease
MPETQNDQKQEASNNTVEKLPVLQLLAFTLAGFLAIMTETLPAGLLPQISQGLMITEAQAGQFITLYALGSVIAAIPVITLTRDWNRRPLFLYAIAGLLIFNSLTAMSTHYDFILVARFFAGMSAGVIWGLLAGYARRLVPFHLQGKALAIASVGQPLALSLGVPLATWLGQFLGWNHIFWAMSALALILMVWIYSMVPDFKSQPQQHNKSISQVICSAGILPILTVLMFWILAHNILYTYIAPFLTHVELGQHIDLILMLFGLSSILGIWWVGVWVDQHLRKLTLISLILFAISSLLLIFSSNHLIVLGCIAIWGITFGGAPTLLQTALADAAQKDADVAQSMLVTVFNLAVAGGGLMGGMILNDSGAAIFPHYMLILIIVALLIVWLNQKHGFKIGQRKSA